MNIFEIILDTKKSKFLINFQQDICSEMFAYQKKKLILHEPDKRLRCVSTTESVVFEIKAHPNESHLF